MYSSFKVSSFLLSWNNHSSAVTFPFKVNPVPNCKPSTGHHKWTHIFLEQSSIFNILCKCAVITFSIFVLQRFDLSITGQHFNQGDFTSARDKRMMIDIRKVHVCSSPVKKGYTFTSKFHTCGTLQNHASSKTCYILLLPTHLFPSLAVFLSLLFYVMKLLFFVCNCQSNVGQRKRKSLMRCCTNSSPYCGSAVCC